MPSGRSGSANGCTVIGDQPLHLHYASADEAATIEGVPPHRTPLPAQPARHLPNDYCTLPGRTFTHLPAKHRAEVTLPVMRGYRRHHVQRSQSEAAVMSRHTDNRHKRDVGNNSHRLKRLTSLGCSSANISPTAGGREKCFGDYCNAEIRYPASLQDIESPTDPWMTHARELCMKPCPRPSFTEELGSDEREREPRPMLLTPEELVACLSPSAPQKTADFRPDSHQNKDLSPTGVCSRPGLGRPTRPCAAFGRVCASWLLVARRCPLLCRWLSESGWMFHSGDTSLLVEAARLLREDDASGNGPATDFMDFHKEGSFPGLRYKLQAVPVCGNCLCIYSTIHNVVSLVRRQRRDLWAERELRRKREQGEEEKKREKEEWLTERITRADGAGFNIESADKQRRSRSLYLDTETHAWLHSLDVDSPATAVTSTRSAKGCMSTSISPNGSPASVIRRPSSRRH
eukprot:TRINITY_DN62880_c0_g1_i1.p1 TRINITY_DN62880_c0_g1~~TRINITY_DN62880_c0_g1_i1.p1  ORF type:complete len:459 (+),score=35.30 TRINITY_DN62880_c0_g1_i1:110-1486(+)